jgi:phenylpyruvate tautomerase PptA (4-oxalocrotonate tautomerase family)
VKTTNMAKKIIDIVISEMNLNDFTKIRKKIAEKFKKSIHKKLLIQ